MIREAAGVLLSWAQLWYPRRRLAPTGGCKVKSPGQKCQAKLIHWGPIEYFRTFYFSGARWASSF